MIVPASAARIVLSTAGSREEAESLANALVDAQLAACVNLIPGLTSIYRWQGAVESTDEVLLLIKTTADNLERVESALRALHSYEVPEFLVLQPESAAPSYLAWILESCGSPRS
ncbi:MAG TPA: divalent-cation tolerance protein CutA [Acidobacteriaceae bacterium]|nr:divalent-cation tolerance protein CutA [Acidobacteriaceae bacterium]